jgi:hypothetical protein
MIPEADRIQIISNMQFGPGHAMNAHVNFEEYRVIGFVETVGTSMITFDGDLAYWHNFEGNERTATENEGVYTNTVVNQLEIAWQHMKVNWISNILVDFLIDDELSAIHTTNIPDGAPMIPIGFYVYHLDQNPSLKVDWVYVRSLVESEPAHSSWGSEETSSTTGTTSIPTTPTPTSPVPQDIPLLLVIAIVSPVIIVVLVIGWYMGSRGRIETSYGYG